MWWKSSNVHISNKLTEISMSRLAFTNTRNKSKYDHSFLSRNSVSNVCHDVQITIKTVDLMAPVESTLHCNVLWPKIDTRQTRGFGWRWVSWRAKSFMPRETEIMLKHLLICYCPWLCLANVPVVSNVKLRGSTYMSDSQQHTLFINPLYHSLSRIP